MIAVTHVIYSFWLLTHMKVLPSGIPDTSNPAKSNFSTCCMHLQNMLGKKIPQRTELLDQNIQESYLGDDKVSVLRLKKNSFVVFTLQAFLYCFLVSSPVLDVDNIFISIR